MTTYSYPNKETKPDLEKIHNDCVAAGLPEPIGCRWDEETKILKVIFENDLTAEQKTTLDGIVSGV